VTVAGGTVSCVAGHSYDIARQGYVSLPAAGRRAPPAGDSEEMVAARDEFLGAGHYARIVTAVCVAGRAGAGRGDGREGCVVDVGAGTGYYLAGVVGELAGWKGVALDASRPALRRAVRADPGIAGVVCDAWGPLPVGDGAADLVLSVFAPRNGAELGRILAPDGVLVVVTPTPDHLRELVRVLGMVTVDPDKPARLEAQLEPYVEAVSAAPVEFAITLDHADLRAVVGMGPSAHHVGRAALADRISSLPATVSVTVGVTVQTFGRRQASSSSRLPHGSSA
jgi:23S rRNA (guanine745-N1)-methyltransferase